MNKKIFFLLLAYLLLPNGMFASVTSHNIIRVRTVGKAPLTVKPASRARLLALRAAIVTAFGEIAGKAGVDASDLSGHMETKKIEAFLVGYKITYKKYISDYQVEIIMEIPAHRVRNNATQYNRQRKKKDLHALLNKIQELETRCQQIKTEYAQIKSQLKQLRRTAKKMKNSQPRKP